VSRRILLVMDPFIRVPPLHYGGIERVVADLAQELHVRGHRVTLWAAPGSAGPSAVQPFGREGEWTRWSNVRNVAIVTSRFLRAPGEFDIVHNFGRLAYLTGVLSWDLPKVQTYMRTVDRRNMSKVRRLGAHRVHFTAVSEAIRHTAEDVAGDWSVIYNCAPVDRFTARLDVDAARAPLVFLGRLERCKGVHTAIRIARRAGRPLIIAGNISTLPEERAYFEREISPQIDGRLVTYVGPVDDAQKNALLGSAAAMLLPVEWLEPFPVVLPEALACGTPIVATRCGGIPEGIDHGRTGFVCDSEDEMVEAVSRLERLDRSVCRREAERRFSPGAITTAYEALYERVLHAA